ncbi:TetR/AcrR family transcriptional regulator [Streptosporangium sp. NPDC000396]|uniref:TetR/AcrR family transcriptional regulator n=1 Tax=Streptosporangium sp. NPDC000396 TaxID=3366185 RepID=UPI0036BF315D
MDDDARPLRADARRNRALVLEAAEAILARDGLGASMRAIARHAGVGLGTIYRHFPTQEALYQAIIIDRTQRLVDRAQSLHHADDPGAAFFDFFTDIVENATRKKTLADVLADAGIDAKAGMSEISRNMRDAIETLLTRAQRAGAVRDDLHMPELLALLAATCMAAERNQWDRELRTRTLAIVFDGCRPRG